MGLKSEGRSSRAGRGEPQQHPDKKNQAKQLAGRVACILGILLALGGIVGGFLGVTEDVSAGVLAMVLGVLGYYFGARRLGAATVVLGTVALFFLVAASTGLIPGVAPLGHGYNG